VLQRTYIHVVTHKELSNNTFQQTNYLLDKGWAGICVHFDGTKGAQVARCSNDTLWSHNRPTTEEGLHQVLHAAKVRNCMDYMRVEGKQALQLLLNFSYARYERLYRSLPVCPLWALDRVFRHSNKKMQIFLCLLILVPTMSNRIQFVYMTDLPMTLAPTLTLLCSRYTFRSLVVSYTNNEDLALLQRLLLKNHYFRMRLTNDEAWFVYGPCLGEF
jgi:hypothetical protein